MSASKKSVKRVGSKDKQDRPAVKSPFSVTSDTALSTSHFGLFEALIIK